MSDGDGRTRGAIVEINEARQRALAGVSEIRQTQTSMPHPNLAPANGAGEQASLPVVCTQYAANYLLQLRPYRQSSAKWNTELGVVELPARLDGGERPGRDRGTKPPLELMQSQQVPLGDISALIAAMNKTIYYKSSEETKVFKFVFGQDTLLKIVELADEVAAEMDLLAKLDDPREQDGSGV